MFAYCNNGPVVSCDPDGDARVLLWYFLFLYSEFGYIHLQVQLHILATHPNTYLMEVGVNKANGKYGRADIFCPGTGEVWEVKSRGCAGLALGQAEGYVGGTTCVTEQKVSELGKGGAFSGSFVINYLDQSYEVVYSTPEPGVIIYDVSTRSQYEPNPEAVYSPKKNEASLATNNNVQYCAYRYAAAGIILTLALCKPRNPTPQFAKA